MVLKLDANEIFPDDPGMGTPAMVEIEGGKYASTFWCAANEGEVEGVPMTSAQCEWIWTQEDVVDKFIKDNSPTGQ